MAILQYIATRELGTRGTRGGGAGGGGCGCIRNKSKKRSKYNPPLKPPFMQAPLPIYLKGVQCPRVGGVSEKWGKWLALFLFALETYMVFFQIFLGIFQLEI